MSQAYPGLYLIITGRPRDDGGRVLNRAADLPRARDAEVSIRSADRLPYGLAAFAFVRDLAMANRLGGALDAGMVGVNTVRISVPDSPFGGTKESGHGFKQGTEGLDACRVNKFVSEA